MAAAAAAESASDEEHHGQRGELLCYPALRSANSLTNPPPPLPPFPPKYAHPRSPVGLAFFWQSPGAMAPYVVAWLLVQFPIFAGVTSLDFRLLFASGALPAAAVLWLTWQQGESPEFEAARAAQRGGALEAAPSVGGGAGNMAHWRTLVGTGGTWLLYDIGYYGTAVFTPTILISIFGSSSSMSSLCWQSIVVTVIGLPGALLAIYLLKPMGAKWLNTWGKWSRLRVGGACT